MQAQPRIAALILAAGSSTRFGSPKQTAMLGGRTLLESVVKIAATARLDPIMVVVPPGLAVPPRAVAVVNLDPSRGMSSSLQLGIGALPAEVRAAVVLLGDQPTLDPATIRALIAARGQRPIVAAAAEGLPGPPVLLERRAWELVERLSGDVGLRDVIRGHRDLVQMVEVPAHAPDIDTPDDLARIGHMFESADR